MTDFRPRRLPAGLAVLALGLQLVGWSQYLPLSRDGEGRVVFALAEMTLLALLLWHGWRIRQWVYAQTQDAGARSIANLTFVSLAFCILGDGVNRNFSQTFYAYDYTIEHSYLADSVWFFGPGYAALIVAGWLATRGRIPAWLRALSLGVAAAAGALLFARMAVSGTSRYVIMLTGSYSVLIAMLAAVGLWILLGLGRSAWHVALGALLATVADAIIGQYWLFGRGFYPGVAHLNFGVYFLSQALVQQLPLVYARGILAHRPHDIPQPEPAPTQPARVDPGV